MLSIRVDPTKPALSVETTWWTIAVLGFIGLAFGIIWFVRTRWRERAALTRAELLEVEISDRPKLRYVIDRSEENIQIAHRILIELVTRKAALHIDPERDVIKEIYDSWYALFGTIRNELKSIPGRYLRRSDGTTYRLVELTLAILNEALRPHLTEFQADFRHWYEHAIRAENATGKSPQELQKEYPRYRELIDDMLRVNRVLINYADQLRKLISSSQ